MVDLDLKIPSCTNIITSKWIYQRQRLVILHGKIMDVIIARVCFLHFYLQLVSSNVISYRARIHNIKAQSKY
jgi:hypothetical protein